MRCLDCGIEVNECWGPYPNGNDWVNVMVFDNEFTQDGFVKTQKAVVCRKCYEKRRGQDGYIREYIEAH